jgi:hypothetical protein
MVLAAACPLALAQSTQKQEVSKTSTFVIQTNDGKMTASTEPGANTFFYVGSEMAFESGVVKGAPYSGQGVTAFTQTLSDGNRISRQTTSQVYRDSEGRTRREETIGAIGPWASGTDPVQIVHVYDPVAGTGFMLNPKDHTASKMTIRINTSVKPGMGSGSGAGVGAGAAATTMVTADTITMHMAPPPPGGAPGHAFAMAGGQIMAKGQVSKELLGTQEIEGVQAEGVRTTMTIPAGQIGNEQPIQVISERWYSPDLQVVMMTRHSDPRTGEEVYKLTNVNRSEPARQLFEIPADYTIKESGDMMHTFKYDMHTNMEKMKVKQNEQ